MRKLYPFLILALATLQSASAISQYELENKPTLNTKLRIIALRRLCIST